MDIINPLAEKYTEQFTTVHDVLLQQIITETNATHAQPHMLSGHVQGKFLQMISRMLQPLKVLEIGTFTGFSALCLATGLQKDGMLHTIELREQDAIFSQNNFNKSEYFQQIKLHIGNAKEIDRKSVG